MTLGVFIVGLVVFYFLPYRPLEWLLPEYPFLTVYRLFYALTLIVAVGWAIGRYYLTVRTDKDAWRIIWAAVALSAYWLACFYAWEMGDYTILGKTYNGPIMAHAGLSLLIAAYFAINAQKNWEFLIGAIFVASVCCGIATEFGVIASGAERPRVYVALAHPDLLSILGHAASIVLGAAAGDGGLRIRDILGRRSVAVHYRADAVRRVAAVVKMAAGSKKAG